MGLAAGMDRRRGSETPAHSGDAMSDNPQTTEIPPPVTDADLDPSVLRRFRPWNQPR